MPAGPTSEDLQQTLQGLLDEAARAAVAHGGAPRGDSPSATPGAAALIAHRGEVLAQAHAGWAVLFAEDGSPLPETDRERVTAGHLWDIASVTKMVVTVAALVQADRGALDLEAPVGRYLPEFANGPDGEAPPGARGRVTVRHLLNHTSGLPAIARTWTVAGGRAERAAYVLSRPLEREPGAAHEYSCVGYTTLGLALERITGTSLPQLVAETVTGPLGMTATGYEPSGGRPVAATEYDRKAGRGLVQGEVHDEAAWALGGAGNAGLFSDAEDLLRFGEEIRTGRRHLLSEASRALLSTGTLEPEEAARVGYDQAAGFRLGQQAFMGTEDRAVFGHTGFTGTSLVIDPAHELVIVLLTNRVHPDRETFGVMELRRAVADLGRASTGAR